MLETLFVDLGRVGCVAACGGGFGPTRGGARYRGQYWGEGRAECSREAKGKGVIIGEGLGDKSSLGLVWGESPDMCVRSSLAVQ